MNTQSNAVPDSLRNSQAIPPAALSETRPLYWSIRREIWENHSIYVAPLAIAAVYLFSFGVSVIWLPNNMREVWMPHTMREMATLKVADSLIGLAMPYTHAVALVGLVAFMVGIFYSLDAVRTGRRDRSILFWKSLPVSDVTTVLSKAAIPLVVLPLITVALTVATQFIMLLLSSAILRANGVNVTAYWAQLSLFQMSLMLFYHLLTVHVLGHAPFYCWLLLVSAWARRAAFLWAFLPPLAIAVVEKIAFNTSYFAAMLGAQLSGGSEAVAFPDRMPIDPGMHLTPGHFLSSPGLWIGLALATAFLATAVRLRRYREPI